MLIKVSYSNTYLEFDSTMLMTQHERKEAIYLALAQIPKGARVLTFNYDTGERYMSIDGLF